MFPGKRFLDATSGHWKLWIQHISRCCELTLRNKNALVGLKGPQKEEKQGAWPGHVQEFGEWGRE